MGFAIGYASKNAAIKATRKKIKTLKPKVVYGRRGGKIPISQARVTAVRIGKGWYPTARRK